MKNYFLVLKLLFSNTFRLDKENKKKRRNLLIIIGCVVLPIIAMLCIMIYFMAKESVSSGVAVEFLSFMFFTGQLIVMIFGLSSLLSYMFFSTDAEFLLSLPVKKSTLFIAKFTMVYISEMLITLIVLVPAIIVSGIAMEAGIIFYLLLPLGVLMLPMISLLFITLLSFPIMYVVSFFKKRGMLAAIFLIAAFTGIMAVYFAFISRMTSSAGEEIQITLLSPELIAVFETINNILLPNKWFSSAMLNIDTAVNIIFFIVSVIGLLVISVIIGSLLFFKGVTSQVEGSGQTASKKTESVQNSTISSIVKKDLKQLIRSPGFAFQSLLGIFLTPLLIVFYVYLFGGSGAFAGDETIEMPPLLLAGLIFMMNIIFLGGMNFYASAAITREGKAFYINKYIPVEYSDILKAKLKFADYVAMVGVVIMSLVLLGYSFFTSSGIEIYHILLIAAGLMFVCAGFNALAIKRDIKKPKLDWKNAQEAMKNNIYMLLPMLLGFLLGLGVMLICIFVSSIENIFIQELLFWSISLIACGGIAYLMRKDVFADAPKYFERIEQ